MTLRSLLAAAAMTILSLLGGPALAATISGMMRYAISRPPLVLGFRRAARAR